MSVATVMNESSTGVRNPVEEIGDVVDEYPDTYFRRRRGLLSTAATTSTSTNTGST